MDDMWTGDNDFLKFIRKDRKIYSEVLDTYKKDMGPDNLEATGEADAEAGRLETLMLHLVRRF